MAEAIKSIAEQRGWNHWGHHLLNDATFQLSEEWNRPDVLSMYDAVEKLHINFYEDRMELDEIESRISSAKTFLDYWQCCVGSIPGLSQSQLADSATDGAV